MCNFETHLLWTCWCRHLPLSCSGSSLVVGHHWGGCEEWCGYNIVWYCAYDAQDVQFRKFLPADFMLVGPVSSCGGIWSTQAGSRDIYSRDSDNELLHVLGGTVGTPFPTCMRLVWVVWKILSKLGRFQNHCHQTWLNFALPTTTWSSNLVNGISALIHHA